MSLNQLIASDIPTLSPGHTGNSAIDIMDEHKLPQLPVVADDQYVALIRESDLLDWSTPDAELSATNFMSYKPAIGVLAHPYEAMRMLNEMNLSVLPVTDSDHKYIGTVTKDSLLKYFMENSSIMSPGGIIVLEIAPRNYTLYEIARICENEDVIIMNLQVRTNELGMLEVTLKLNRTALDAVVSSFERHSYRVVEVYGEESNNEDIAGKYNLLMNYINM